VERSSSQLELVWPELAPMIGDLKWSALATLLSRLTVCLLSYSTCLHAYKISLKVHSD